MRFEHPDDSADKGWYIGPWNSDLKVSVGYANRGIDEPHVHARITELYLVARGSAEVRIETDTVTISTGDMLAIEAGEAHTFLSSSPDYFHFVIHTPGLAGETARAEKSNVSKKRLGL
jgi:mannose-6-phosphate isomerase-like protein (cupin superfamily)